MSETKKYGGLDVHKNTIAVAVAKDGKRGKAREHGEIVNTPTVLTKLLGQLGGPGVELHMCYETGPRGYGILRQVAAAGHSCVVFAPSLISSCPGDRIKTDRRDALKIARLHRAGELTSVWIPDGSVNRRCFVIEFAFHLRNTLNFSEASPRILRKSRDASQRWHITETRRPTAIVSKLVVLRHSIVQSA